MLSPAATPPDETSTSPPESTWVALATPPDAAALTGTVKLSGLAGGDYTATDLFTNATNPVTVSGGHAAMAVTLSRWDTRVFALTRP
jgi:hypothetical protein